MATINQLNSLFYERNDIFETDEYLLNNYGELVNKFDVPIGHLMFQFAILFTYYHELAHLIQKSPTISLWFSEQYDTTKNVEFSIEQHILELDADLYGAHSICFHLIQYFNNLGINDKTSENLQKKLSIGIASIFSYFLLYFKDSKNIYYDKYTHPHPLVRISYIVDCFIGAAQINLPQNITVDSDKTLKEAFLISEKFYKNVLNLNLVEDFGKCFFEESENIQTYVNCLLKISENMPQLVKNRN